MEAIIQSGITGVIRTRFVWNRPLTYLSFIIRVMTNLWNFIRGEEIKPYNHSFSIAEDQHCLYVYEAVAEGVIRTEFKEWRSKHNMDDVLFLAPKFELRTKVFEATAKKLLGTKYDFAGTLLFQYVYQITDERLWLGTRKVKRVNCSKFSSYLIYLATNMQIKEDWYLDTPENLIDENLFTIFKISN